MEERIPSAKKVLAGSKQLFDTLEHKALSRKVTMVSRFQLNRGDCANMAHIACAARSAQPLETRSVLLGNTFYSAEYIFCFEYF